MTETVSPAATIEPSSLTGHRRSPLIAVLALAFGAVACLALMVGAVPIDVFDLLRGALTPRDTSVIAGIRLPRILLAAVVGASLAVSGAAMQGLFRNPLADPGLIGISSGAALAVAVTIVLVAPSSSGVLGLYGLSVAAFAGGLATSLMIFRFSRWSGGSSVTYMLLTGIAVTAIAGAGTGFLTFLSDDQQLRTLTFWTMGSLSGALWTAVGVAASVVVPSTLVLFRRARDLNLLLLGEREARYLGVDSDRLKRTVIICTALSVGAAVAVSGIIGFVGLVVPHLVRLMIGPDHRVLIPASALLGGTLVMLADTVARTVVAPAEMSVGILTSLIGGPFFLWLLMTQFSRRQTG